MNSEQETKEKIVRVVKDTCHFAVEDGKCLTFDRCTDTDCFFADEQADRILSLLKELGYRKVPELKVMSGEEIKEFAVKVKSVYYTGGTGYLERLSGLGRVVAQAQLEAIIKQIEEYNLLRGNCTG